MMIQHYTIESGDCRESPRSEVSDAAIAALRPILVTGTHDLPGPAGYRLRVTVAVQSLAATVIQASSGAPLVTTYVAVEQGALDAILSSTGARPAVPLRLPCCLVTLHPTLALDPDAMGWLGDLERCIAWAWLESLS